VIGTSDAGSKEDSDMHIDPFRAACLAAAAFALVVSAPAFAETLSYKTALKSADEVPPNDSKGSGAVDASYDTSSKKLTWTITYSGLTGPATAAHFHSPAEPGKNAPPTVPLSGKLDSPIKGEATLTDAQAADLKDGKMYFNVHTAANKGGEIRGQMMKK
jgi:hypothetical protein